MSNSLQWQKKCWERPKWPSVNCEITLDLNWSKKCIIKATAIADQGAIFCITHTKLYVPVVNLSTLDNIKLL